MEVRLETSSIKGHADIGQGIACLHLGSVKKQVPLGSDQTLPFPASAEKVHGSIQIYKLVASCSVCLDPNSAAELHDYTVPCAEPRLAPLTVRLGISGGTNLGGDTASLRPALLRERCTSVAKIDNYVSAHGLTELLDTAVKELLQKKPLNPHQFLEQFFGKLSGDWPRSTPRQGGDHPGDPPSIVVSRQQTPKGEFGRLESKDRSLALVNDDFSRAVSKEGKRIVDFEGDFERKPSLNEMTRMRSKEGQQQRRIVDLETALVEQRRKFEDSVRQMEYRLQRVERDQPLTFSVLQYNILANYLGKNTQPWLLYGAEVSQELRDKIFAKFYEKGEDGKFVNVGWPKYAVGLLSDEEIKAVEEYDRRCFAWEVRRPKLIETLRSSDADIMSLVELDEYEDFCAALPEWDSAFRKRPRRSTKDGCGVYWRRSKFRLVEWEAFDFDDSTGPSAQSQADRSCVIVLLAFVANPRSRVIVVSTHLARNPESTDQTKVRARQAAQLMKNLTDFASRFEADDVAVVWMGDLNAQHFGEIRGIARTVFQVYDHPCHQFLFRCSDVPTGPTSFTETRNVRIDVVMFEPTHLQVLEIDVPPLTSKIPDETHPSDHVPVRVKFVVKAPYDRQRETAASWLECVAGKERVSPLTDREIRQAFSFIDRDGRGMITRNKLAETCLETGRIASNRQELLLTCFDRNEIDFDQFIRAYEVRLCESRLRGVDDLEQAFHFFDSEGVGKLSLEQLMIAFRDVVPIEFSEVEISDLFEEADVDEDGLIDIRSFCRLLSSHSCTQQADPSVKKVRSKRLQTIRSEDLRERLAIFRKQSSESGQAP
eukprot:TRINITY_DN55087_c0_g1_i1.p1 TRINITY_DN55087_c0_g1~~TRINITY_DN55087_c0_g1_i1.p1  ORF type:complete len:824 (-),score=170.47 TRINITY_DN55087_c0_g1_i1:41-2512(-)